MSFVRNVKRGFTLIELIVSMFVVVVGLLATTRLVVGEYWSANRSLLLSNEVLLAQNLTEKILGENFDDLDTACQQLRGVRMLSGKHFYVSCNLIAHSEKLKQILISISLNNTVYTVSVFRSLGD